ncbi:MAG: hypothetical protein IT384_18925 [Deltaproteobacteria bacterium]|nr:hypothetical protein [Deltaproteobacteria bacterium]
MIRDRIEVSATMLGGKGEPKRGVAAIERNGPGVYEIRFPPEKSVHAETYQLAIAIVNASEPRTWVFTGSGGASIGVRIFDARGEPIDADFQFTAERL